MASRMFWKGILVIISVFGLAFYGFADDLKLNCTWAGVAESASMEVTFNNGNYEASMDGIPTDRGTYTTKGDNITFQLIYIHSRSPLLRGLGDRLATGWYPKDQMLATIEKTIGEVSKEDCNLLTSFPVFTYYTYSYIGNDFNESTLPIFTYTINSSTLTIKGKKASTFLKKLN